MNPDFILNYDFYLRLLVWIGVAFLPLPISLRIAYTLPSGPRWKGFLVALLFLQAVLVGWGFFIFPHLWMPATVFMLAGCVVSLCLGIYHLLRVFTGIPAGRAFLVTVLPIFTLLAGIDLRFRVTVRNQHGEQVAILPGALELHHPPKAYLQDYHTSKGIPLWKGTVYFGFLTWNRHQDEWTLLNYGPDSFPKMKWSDWPKVVVMDDPSR